MANKYNDAILMAILQDINEYLTGNQSGNATSTGTIAMANIKRDGADMNDVHEIATNDLFDQNNDIYGKIQYQFQQHPEIASDLDKFADENGLMQEPSNNELEELAQLIALYLQQKRKYAEGGQFEQQDNWTVVTIGNKQYHLLIAETEEEKEKGLMGVIEMDPDEGMLFDYSDDPQAEMSFWMKDTEIPLDIIFINQDGIVISVKQGKPFSEELITESSDYIAYVIELNINSGVQPDDKTDLVVNSTSEEPIEEPIEEESEEDEYPDVPINALHVYGPDGDIQAYLQGGERIFSRRATKIIINKAKKCYMTKEDKDYKALGRYVFDEMRRQDGREPEYVQN